MEAAVATHLRFPGFCFLPTDEELIIYFLRRHISGNPLPPGFVVPADVYGTEPWNLFGDGQEEEEEGYFFARRVRSSDKAKRPSRKAGKGSWHTIKNVEEIKSSVDGHGVVTVGIKQCLNYIYEKKKTEWIMYEFMLGTGNPNQGEGAFQERVLCHIKKSDQEISKSKKRKSEERPPAPDHYATVPLAMTTPHDEDFAAAAAAVVSDDHHATMASERHEPMQDQFMMAEYSYQQVVQDGQDQRFVEEHYSVSMEEILHQEQTTAAADAEADTDALAYASDYQHALIVSDYAEKGNLMMAGYFDEYGAAMEVQLHVPAMPCEQPLNQWQLADEFIGFEQGTTTSATITSSSWLLPTEQQQQEQEQELLQLPLESSADQVMTSWDEVSPWAQNLADTLLPGGVDCSGMMQQPACPRWP